MKVHVIAVIGIVLFSLFFVDVSYGENFGIEFTRCDVSDNEDIKDVGIIDAMLQNNKYIVIQVGNAYSGYEAYVDVTVLNNHDDAMTVDSILITNDDPTALSVELTGISVGTTLESDESVDAQVTITVLPGVEQSSSYTFSIAIFFTPW